MRSVLNGKNLAKLLPQAVAAALVALVALRFGWMQVVLARAEAAAGGGHALPFLAISLALCLGPGLFVWRAARLSSDSPALFLVHLLATGLGFAMLVPWLLLLVGLWTRGAALALVLAAAGLGIAAMASFLATPSAREAARRGIASALQSLTPSEALALAFALVVGELLFELLAGSPMQGWDAFLSWDRWAEELAAAHSLGRRAFGFYPPGLPLLGSVFYKLLPATGSVPASTAHLLLHGFHAVFPLLLLLSVCALSRPMGFNPLAGQALVLSDFFLVQSLLKQTGDADVPLAALCAAALALTLFAAAPRKGAAPFPAVAAVCAPALFALFFVKGSGVAMLPVLGLTLHGAVKDRAVRRRVYGAIAVALVLALPFYLHQGALSLFPSLVKHDPLLLALPLETAHTDLFSPNLAHLTAWVHKAGPNLCLGNALWTSFATVLLATAAILVALFDRRARPAAGGAAILFALWFFTASYDWRNAFPAHLLACLAIAAVLQRLAETPRWPVARAAAEVVVVLTCLALFSRQRLPELFPRLVRRPVRPAMLAVAEGDRPSAISELRGHFSLLSAVPFLRDAPHLLLPGRDYRLVPNGVRGLPYPGADTFASPCPGDLAFKRRGFFGPTADYRPVAQLHVPDAFGRTMFLYRPAATDIPFRLDADGEGALLLNVSTEARSGFLEITLASPVPERLDFRAVREPKLGAPAQDTIAQDTAGFDSLFLPLADGSVLRIPFWFPEGVSDSAPSFHIVPAKGFRVLSVRLLR